MNFVKLITSRRKIIYQISWLYNNYSILYGDKKLDFFFLNSNISVDLELIIFYLLKLFLF